MKSELIVDVQKDDISIALTEDGRLAEVNREKRELTYSVGNIYYGKVKKIMPGLNAAFVDVGYQKDAFIHYLDLGPKFNTTAAFLKQVTSNRRRLVPMSQTKQLAEVGKQGQIGDYLTVGQEILVQVVKEPISTKGPRLTAEISLAGRYMVLMPFQDKVSVSNKITRKGERNRLKQLIQSMLPAGYGVIVRTVAEDKNAADLDAELQVLIKRWEDTLRKLQKAKPVQLVCEEMGRTIGIIRDIFNPSFDHIYVNDSSIFEEVRQYVSMIAPEREKCVEHYTELTPIFDQFGVTRQLKSGFGRTVSFKNGGYLIIDHAEALHVIDVNSGHKSIAEDDQEQNAYEFNLLAADEIAHQLRLRDMGGIIVIDFIDMHTAEHNKGLYDHMRELMKNDRARHNILPLSKFGLMQITRQRVRPVVDIEVQETCPTCHGTGKAQPSILLTDEIEKQVRYVAQELKHEVILHVHPYVYAYICQGFLNSLKRQWRKRYGRMKLIPNQSLGMMQYKFYDRDGVELDLSQMQEGAN